MLFDCIHVHVHAECEDDLTNNTVIEPVHPTLASLNDSVLEAETIPGLSFVRERASPGSLDAATLGAIMFSRD